MTRGWIYLAFVPVNLTVEVEHVEQLTAFFLN